jgi:hypothetical protein
MTNEVKINVPEGYEIDEENSTFECIKFKPIVKNELPKTWEEFCKTYNMTPNEYWIGDGSELKNTYAKYRSPILDANMLPNKETAKAILALCQLIQLRDCYNDGWVPDWRKKFTPFTPSEVWTPINPSEVWFNTGGTPKYTIYFYENQITRGSETSRQQVLAFKTAELRDQFLENFRDLIEIAKPLL